MFRGCRLFAPGYFFTGFCTLAVLNFSIENNEKNNQQTNKNGYDLGITLNTLLGTVSGRSWERFWEAKWSPGRSGREAKRGKESQGTGKVGPGKGKRRKAGKGRTQTQRSSGPAPQKVGYSRDTAIRAQSKGRRGFFIKLKKIS